MIRFDGVVVWHFGGKDVFVRSSFKLLLSNKLVCILFFPLVTKYDVIIVGGL